VNGWLWAAVGALFTSAALIPVFYYYLERRERDARARLDKAREEAAARALEQEKARLVEAAATSARDELSKARAQALESEEKARTDQKAREARLAAREDALDQRVEACDARERAVTAREAALAEARSTLEGRSAEVELRAAQSARALERVSGLSKDDARAQLLERLETESDASIDAAIALLRGRARAAIEAEARATLTAAIERVPLDHAAEPLVTTVHLASDEAKMRIVGREGRNVRSLEEATGVDILIDDTPGVVVVSAFDPVRRETARRALEKLLQDGRIHPVAVEHAVAAAKEELEALIPKLGEEAAREAQVSGLPPLLLAMLGRLEFRLSYGQNVRRHAIEVSRVAGALAAELGLDPALARRAALLHDIGKATAEDEVPGSHAAAGAAILRRAGELEAIAAAVEHHHDVDEGTRPALSALVWIADRISAHRPGARAEQFDLAVKRFQDLEAIAGSFPGVKKAYAVQAGREVRILVDPLKVNDKMATRLARDVAKAIEEKLTYPGEIRVTVLREVRAAETAK
jgi:ribonuclease Y